MRLLASSSSRRACRAGKREACHHYCSCTARPLDCAGAAKALTHAEVSAPPAHMNHRIGRADKHRPCVPHALPELLLLCALETAKVIRPVLLAGIQGRA